MTPHEFSWKRVLFEWVWFFLLCFSEEIEKLERELENAIKEMENLKLNQSKVLEQLHRQDEVNKSLKEKTLQQKQSCEDLQRDVDTKNELVR